MPHRPRVPPVVRSRLALAAVLVLVGGCDSGPGCVPSEPACFPEEGGDRVVDGVDLLALFAPPRPGEVDAVRAAWGTPERADIVLRNVTTLDLGGRETVRVVAGFERGGTDTVFVGAVRQPPRAAGDTRTRPSFLFLGDGPDADVASLATSLPIDPALHGEFVTLFMAYRGGALTVGGRTFRSDVPPDPYDADADDALAFLAGLRTLPTPEPVDLECVVEAGHGRGGTVTLLAIERAKERGEPLPPLVVSLAAPTDFFLRSVREAGRRYLLGRDAGSISGLDRVLAQTAGRVRSGEATLQDARLDLLRRSPAYFSAPPPFIVGAHGGRDAVVPVEHGLALDGLVGTSEAVFFALPEADHETILRDPQPQTVVNNRVRQFVLADGAPCRR